jgi:F-type H+-transporting ATPase subunit c
MRKLLGIVLWTLLFVTLPMVAMAAEPGEGAFNSIGAGGTPDAYVLRFNAIGAGLAVGLAGLGCGIGQGLTAGNTTAGIARNPGAAGSMFTPFILAMVMIESIAIYGFLIAILLWLDVTALFA